MDHVERRSGVYEYEAAHRPPPRPVRGGGVAPGPLKVYCVEPRDFRELVQRLTGAGPGTTAASAPAPTGPAMAMAARQRVINHGRVEAAATEQMDYAAWFSAPLLSPAYPPAGFDGHHALL